MVDHKLPVGLGGGVGRLRYKSSSSSSSSKNSSMLSSPMSSSSSLMGMTAAGRAAGRAAAAPARADTPEVVMVDDDDSGCSTATFGGNADGDWGEKSWRINKTEVRKVCSFFKKELSLQFDEMK